MFDFLKIKKKIAFFLNQEKGSTLVLTVIVVAGALLTVTTIVSVATEEKKMSEKMKHSMMAFQAADSGLEYSLKKIKEETGTIENVLCEDSINEKTGECNPNISLSSGKEINNKLYFWDIDKKLIIDGDQAISEISLIKSIGKSGVGNASTSRSLSLCLPFCTALGKNCGDDGCGGNCGDCSSGDVCGGETEGICCTPTNGGWSNWSNWSSCSATCNGGTQVRTRVCNNPSPTCGGVNCIGSTTQSQTCNTQCCPINGGWSSWSSWSSCNSNNKKHRDRTCNNPTPLCGGTNCSGSNRQWQSCCVNYVGQSCGGNSCTNAGTYDCNGNCVGTSYKANGTVCKPSTRKKVGTWKCGQRKDGSWLQGKVDIVTVYQCSSGSCQGKTVACNHSKGCAPQRCYNKATCCSSTTCNNSYYRNYYYLEHAPWANPPECQLATRPPE